MSGTPRKLAEPLIYYRGSASRIVTTYLEQVQVEANGWQLGGPAPASDRFVLLSEFQAALRDVGVSAGSGGNQRYITVSGEHAYFDPAGVTTPAVATMVDGHLLVEAPAAPTSPAVSPVNGHLVVETGV